MKKIVLALATAASFACGGAFAQGYVGVAVGASNFDSDCTGLTSCDNDSTGAKIFGGYKFTPNLAGEVTYFDYGKATARLGSFNAELRGTGLGVGLAVMGDFGPQWSGVGRLGIASNKAKATGTQGSASGSQSETHATAYAGLGISYAITKQMKIDGALDFSRVEIFGDKVDVRLISIGLTYGF